MYKFKVGDTVRLKDFPNSPDFVIQEITTDGWHRKRVGDKTESYMPNHLVLICPAGYRPVREDEMDQYPQAGDVFIHMGQITSMQRQSCYTFREHVGLTTFYRPLIKQKCDYGWCDISNGKGCTGLTEQEAKSAAEKFSKEHSVETFVYKVVGKFAVKTETKVEWNGKPFRPSGDSTG